jgi:TusA-related sulfurtransferase
MYAYKEIITVDNLQQLTLSKPLKLPIGKKVEVLVIAEDDGESLEDIRDFIKQQGIAESMVKDAIEWARK